MDQVATARGAVPLLPTRSHAGQTCHCGPARRCMKMPSEPLVKSINGEMLLGVSVCSTLALPDISCVVDRIPIITGPSWPINIDWFIQLNFVWLVVSSEPGRNIDNLPPTNNQLLNHTPQPPHPTHLNHLT